MTAKYICFYFQVHQPFRLRTYRFFDIGENSDYWDDLKNRTILRKVAEKCYLPTNQLMLELIKKYDGRFRISYSISGTAMEQFERYAPEVLDSFKRLADTGCVEFLAETYAHSLVALKDPTEFKRQVEKQIMMTKKHFNTTPKTFRNTELIYSDDIGQMVYALGFETMLTEGAKHILGWKSPGYLYCNSKEPQLKLLLKNFQLSDDIAFRFSQRSWGEWPLTTEKYASWLNAVAQNHEVVNLFMDYETFGEHQWESTGIFEFMRHLPDQVFKLTPYSFATPAEVSKSLQPVASIHVPFPVSWADEERDLTAWLGNDLQDDAFEKIYQLSEKVMLAKDPNLIREWQLMQTSDHFYYMCTKWFADGDVHKYFNPYNTPYDAYINYMNVISDFELRVNNHLKNQNISLKSSSEAEKIQNTTRKAKANKLPGKDLSFSSIAVLSNIAIKQLIRSLDIELLAIGLKGAKKPILEKIKKNLGKRRLEALEKLLAQKYASTDVTKSRKAIERKMNDILS